MEAHELVSIGPALDRGPSAFSRQTLEFVPVVFVGVLGMDRLPFF